MRRILLVLAVALAMVVMAMPSAGAQPESTKYCQSGIAWDPGSNACYDTLQECLDFLFDPQYGCSETRQSDIVSDYGQTNVDQRLCQDPTDTRPVCQDPSA